MTHHTTLIKYIAYGYQQQCLLKVNYKCNNSSCERRYIQGTMCCCSGVHRLLYCSKTWVHDHTNTHTQVFFQLRGSRKLHLTTRCTSQLPTTSQHHSPTLTVSHNHTIRVLVHAHTMPTHTSPTGTCMLIIVKKHKFKIECSHTCNDSSDYVFSLWARL